MKLISKLASLFKGSPQDRFLLIHVQCGRCQEVIQARIDLDHDLSAEYGEDEKETGYYCRKVLLGKKNCSLPVEIELRFDARRNLQEKRIKGGKFADEQPSRPIGPGALSG